MNSPRLKLAIAALLLGLTPLPTQRAIAQVTGTPQVAQAVSDRKAEANRLFQQGKQQDQTSQFQDALQSYQQALSLYREIGDRAGEGATLNNIGIVYNHLGQYPQALEQYQQALAILRDIGDRAGEGATLNNIGNVYRSLGQYPQALEQYQQALVISRAVGDRAGEGATLSNIGAVYSSLGRYPQALEQFQQALAILRAVGDRAGEGVTLNDIGNVYSSLGRYPQALEQLQQALVISRAVGDRAGEGVTLNDIGNVYSSLGQYPQALEQLQQALAILREIGDRAGEGRTLGNIGLVYDSLGRYPQALERYQQALVISRAVGDRATEGMTLNNIGGVYDQLGQYPQAKEQYQQALAILREIGDRAMEGTTLNNIGLVYAHLGQYPQAKEQYQQTLAILREIGDRAGEGTTLNNIGSVYAHLGQYPQALEQYQQALVISRAVGDRAGEGRTLNNLGSVLLSLEQIEAATEALLNAVEVLESLRSSDLADADKVSLFDTQRYTYVFLQQALIAQNQPETALEVAERGRTQAFAELLAKRWSSPDRPAASVPQPSIAQIKQIAREQNSTLVEYSITYALVKVEGREQWKPSELYIWVVKPTGEIGFRSVDLTALDVPLNELVNYTRQAIGARGRGSAPLLPPQIGRQPEQAADRLQQLYQVLIEPIADLLPTSPNDAIVFIPQRELFLAPFPALRAANGKYLIESHTVLTSPSIQVLALTQHSAQAKSIDPSEPLVVGNPTMPSLPLAPSAQDDGLLTSSEILNLKLNGSLVVLSACDTGRGDITGDGVIGLSRSLLSAGASSVIVSLWNVQDDSTAALMAEFYRQLQQQPDRAQALRQAMLKTMADYPDPIDWAAFTLIGETE